MSGIGRYRISAIIEGDQLRPTHSLRRCGPAGEQPNPRGIRKRARFLLAARLFDLGRRFSGKAAEFCGMLRADFLISLESVGISAVQLRPEDLEDEVAFGRRS